MNKKTILAGFLILLLLMAGCNLSEEASVADNPDTSTPKVIVKEKSVKTSQQPVRNNEGSPAVQPDSENNLVSEETEPGSADGSAANHEPQENHQVRLVVTRDFGQGIIFNQQVQIKKQQDAMSLTAAHLEVKTSYGGSFLNAINGLESGYSGKMALKRQKQDWFLYINGTLAPCGAGDIRPGKGDTVWWEYHNWDATAFTPAMIGAFPHPFTGRVLLAYSPSAREAANQLATGLKQQGINQVQIQEVNNQVIKERKCPLIVLGLREEMLELEAFRDLNSRPQKTGLFCQFTDSGFRLLNPAMEEGRVLDGKDCACIQASGNGMGDVNPVWLVIAGDASGLERAVKYLSQGKIDPHCAWGLVLNPEGVIPLPLR